MPSQARIRAALPIARTAVLVVFATLVGLAPLQAQPNTAPAEQDPISGPVKIAVVHLDSLVALSPAAKVLQDKLDAFQKEVNAESEQKAEAARQIGQQISDGANSLSEDRLAELQKNFEDATI